MKKYYIRALWDAERFIRLEAFLRDRPRNYETKYGWKSLGSGTYPLARMANDRYGQYITTLSDEEVTYITLAFDAKITET